MDAYFSLIHVSKTFDFGTMNAKPALCDVSLTLARGDFVTIVGSNGAGKSTLFNVVLGNYPIDSGKIMLDGENITNQKDYRRSAAISCLYQNPLRGSAANMTIEENLALAYMRKAKRTFFALNSRDCRYFQDQLARLGLGLENRMKTKMGLLSGGQRQAASFIMATISEPKLLLLDEHTASLDPLTAEKVMEITAEIIREKKITAMMITHDLNCAIRYGNRTIMMDKGAVLCDIFGKTREGLTSDGLIELFNNHNKVNLLDDRMLFIPHVHEDNHIVKTN